MFLDFISYSGGPLPEDLLAVIKVPVVMGWGDQDPWEPIEQGRAFAQYDSVEVKANNNSGPTRVLVLLSFEIYFVSLVAFCSFVFVVAFGGKREKRCLPLWTLLRPPLG